MKLFINGEFVDASEEQMANVYNALEANKHQNLSVEEKRMVEYALRGLSPDELVVALWEMLVENRPEAAQVLQQKRLEVKAKFPKG